MKLYFLKFVLLFIVIALIGAIISILFLPIRLPNQQKTPEAFLISIVPTPTPTHSPQTVLLATGDVMLGRSVRTQTEKSGNPLYPFLFVKDLLQSADITVINLENPLIDPCPKSDTGMKFCAPIATAETLAQAGIDAANLSNNHTKNYGDAGYQSTLAALRSSGIRPFDNQQPAMIEKNGLKFGFLGLDLVSSTPDQEKILNQVSNLNSQVDILVVSIHRGAEYAAAPAESEKLFLRSMVDAGADLIIGHHPHVIQEVEVYKNVPLAYSLGNFVFDQMWSEPTRQGLVGKFIFQGKQLVDYDFIPIYMESFAQPQSVN